MTARRWTGRAALPAAAASAAAAWALSAGGAWSAGAAHADEAATSGPTGDRRYRLEARVAPPAEGRCELSLAAAAREGWHIEPRAPARLELEPSPGVEAQPPLLRTADAAIHDRARLLFRSQLAGCEPGPLRLSGRLKFGICRGESERCQIVRRELDLELAVPASADAP